MLKQDAKIEWNPEAKKSFEEIKKAIVEAPILVNLDYLKSFYIYSFTLDHLCFNILTQKDNDGNEHPIAFMSVSLKYVELRYHNVEK